MNQKLRDMEQALLRRCRQVGINAAFAERRPPTTP